MQDPVSVGTLLGRRRKSRDLDHLHPGLAQEPTSAGSDPAISTPVEGRKLATLTRVSQAISNEIVLEELFDAMMRKAMEQIGAERDCCGISFNKG